MSTNDDNARGIPLPRVTVGKFYIWLNIASPLNYYWNQNAQNWTTDPLDATPFDTREAAESEAVRAEKTYDKGEAIVLQATKPILGAAVFKAAS